MADEDDVEGDIDAEIRELEAILSRMGRAEDVRRCPTCQCSKPKSMEGQERSRLQHRIASLRSAQAFDAGENDLAIRLASLADRSLTTEHKFRKGWIGDEMIAIRETLDKTDEQTSQFQVLQGRPKKKGVNLSLAPQPD